MSDVPPADVPAQPTPPQRIGDAERDHAVRELQTHHAAGRLDMAEFDQRMQTALTAKTRADLAPLFVDLPGTDFGSSQSRANLAVPGAAGSTPAVGDSASSAMPVAAKKADTTSKWLQLASGLMWPAAIIINFAYGWHLWWLFLIPVFVMPVVFNVFGRDDDGRKVDEKSVDGHTTKELE